MRVIAHSGPSSLLLPRALISSQGLEFYMEKYPDVAGQKVLGFLDYSLLLGLQVRMGPKGPWVPRLLPPAGSAGKGGAKRVTVASCSQSRVLTWTHSPYYCLSTAGPHLHRKLLLPQPRATGSIAHGMHLYAPTADRQGGERAQGGWGVRGGCLPFHSFWHSLHSQHIRTSLSLRFRNLFC